MFTALTGGVSSVIALAHTARGPICVKRALPKLKVSAEWFAPVERNRAEVAWMKIAGKVVPHAVPRILGEDAQAMAFAMEWLDPQRYPVWKAQLRDGVVDVPPRAPSAPRSAPCIARPRATPASRATSRTTTRSTPFDWNPISRRAHGRIRIMPRRCAISSWSRRRRSTSWSTATSVPRTSWWVPNGPVLLDAECAWFGDPAFDLAFCLNHLLLKCRWRPTSATAFLACFDALAESYLNHVDWEPREELERRTAHLLAGLLLGRIDGKSPVEYLTADTDRDRVRQFALRHLAAPVARLATLRTRWAEDLAA